MKIYRAIAPAIAALACTLAVGAQAQEATHSQTDKRTVTTVPGKVSTNKTKVVHVKKKHVTAPQPTPGTTVHTSTVTQKASKNASQSGQ